MENKFENLWHPPSMGQSVVNVKMQWDRHISTLPLDITTRNLFANWLLTTQSDWISRDTINNYENEESQVWDVFCGMFSMLFFFRGRGGSCEKWTKIVQQWRIRHCKNQPTMISDKYFVSCILVHSYTRKYFSRNVHRRNF